MTTFRKKPVEVQAFQYLGKATPNDTVPAWFASAVVLRIAEVYEEHILIQTLEGVHRADYGDYIIQGVKGELYPCKPDIFELTYEQVK